MGRAQLLRERQLRHHSHDQGLCGRAGIRGLQDHRARGVPTVGDARRGSRLLIATTYLVLAAAAVLYGHTRLLPPASAPPGSGWPGAPPSGARRAPYPSSQTPLPPGGRPYLSPQPQAPSAGPYPSASSPGPAVGPCAAVSLCARPLAALWPVVVGSCLSAARTLRQDEASGCYRQTALKMSRMLPRDHTGGRCSVNTSS